MVLQSPESRGVSHRGLSEELVVLRCMMHMQRRVWLAMAVPGVAAENLATLNPTYSLSSFFGSPYRILTIHLKKKRNYNGGSSLFIHRSAEDVQGHRTKFGHTQSLPSRLFHVDPRLLQELLNLAETSCAAKTTWTQHDKCDSNRSNQNPKP